MADDNLTPEEHRRRAIERAERRKHLRLFKGEAREGLDDSPDPDQEREAQAQRIGQQMDSTQPAARGNGHDPQPARIEPPRWFWWFGEIEPVLDMQDFVQGILLANTIAVIYGSSNCGKTFFATALALCVAAGIIFAGRRVDQSGVLYVGMEGNAGFNNRVSAWRTAHKLEGQELPFAAMTKHVNLMDDASVSEFISELHHAMTGMQEVYGVPLRLIVIDTLNRALSGANENAPEDMGRIIYNADRIKAATKACVLFVHHSGKDQARGSRGHSSLTAAIDTEIEVTVDDAGARAATVTKERDMQKGDILPFALDRVELGSNRHGEPVTTCLVRFAGAVAPERPSKTGNAAKGASRMQLAYEILCDIIAKDGQPGHGAPGDRLSIPDSWWREKFYGGAMPDAENQDAKKHAFARAFLGLKRAGKIGADNNRVWITAGKPAGTTHRDNDGT